MPAAAMGSVSTVRRPWVLSGTDDFQSVLFHTRISLQHLKHQDQTQKVPGMGSPASTEGLF